MSVSMTKGPKLEYLPIPKTRTQGNYQWELPQKVKKETMLRRSLVGSPLLLLFYGATKTIGVTVEQMLPLLQKASATSLFEAGNGRVIQMPTQIYKSGIDKLIKALVAFFLPSIAGTDHVGRLQIIAFLSDLLPVLAIILTESFRTGNAYTFATV
jgi:hypothetical protein